MLPMPQIAQGPELIANVVAIMQYLTSFIAGIGHICDANLKKHCQRAKAALGLDYCSRIYYIFRAGSFSQSKVGTFIMLVTK